MKTSILFLITLFTITSISAQTDKRLKGIEKELNEILEVTDAAGFAVAVVEGDKIIYSKGFGYSDYENKIPADANTLFAIGSCTKSFTSSILGQLRNDDLLSFDDSPREYVPELKFFNEDMNSSIIIKDMMCHRTGLPRHDWSWYLFPSFDKDELIRRIEFQEPSTGVREHWQYNNFMFLAQGVIAERITGISWEDNIKQRFLEPLGMTRSNVNIAELEKSTNAALGYELTEDGEIEKMDYYKIAGMCPAGSINSSVNEMSNWLITWLNQGEFQGHQVLPASYVSEAMSSQMVIRGALPGSDRPDLHISNYGYGWMISSYKGHYRVEHGGNIDGFSASSVLYPSDSLGIVVLTNQNGSSVPWMVRNTIADRILKVNKTDWIEDFESTQGGGNGDMDESLSDKVENTSPSHIAVDYTGTYNHPGYGEFSIVAKDDSLFAEFALMKFYLSHYHYDIFEIMDVTDGVVDTNDTGGLRVSFDMNLAGDIVAAVMAMEGSIDPLEFKRTPNNIDVDAAVLESYVGDYDLAGTEIKVYIKNESTLYLFVEGQPEYELVATEEHKFSFKSLEGFKVEFVENEDDSIAEVILYQPNGTFSAVRK